MPLDEEFIKQIIQKANEVKNPVTGDRLGNVVEAIIISCGKTAETEDEFLDCIDDAFNELKEIVNEAIKEKKK